MKEKVYRIAAVVTTVPREQELGQLLLTYNETERIDFCIYFKLYLTKNETTKMDIKEINVVIEKNEYTLDLLNIDLDEILNRRNEKDGIIVHYLHKLESVPLKGPGVYRILMYEDREEGLLDIWEFEVV